MDSHPRVSVLLPVFNGEAYLIGAIESILSQSYQDFEILVVDDGSTDRTPDLLKQLQSRDSRLRVFTLEHNQGISSALNTGLQHARGELIARLDADDICLPDRFQRQVDYFQSHPEVGLLGGNCTVINAKGRIIAYWFYPTSDLAIRWKMLFHNAFINSTMMFRREVAEGEQFFTIRNLSEDYDFWLALLDRTQAANLPTSLILYRKHDQSLSSTNSRKQRLLTSQISQQALNAFMNPDFVDLAETQELQRLFRDHLIPRRGDPQDQIHRKWEQVYQKFCEIHHLSDPEKEALLRDLSDNPLPLSTRIAFYFSLLIRDPGQLARRAWKRIGRFFVNVI